MRKTKKKPAAKQYQRARSHKFDLFLFEDEKADLQRKAAARGCTASDLVRFWISEPEPEPRKKRVRSRRKAAPDQVTAAPEPVDPRQITVHEIIEAQP